MENPPCARILPQRQNQYADSTYRGSAQFNATRGGKMVVNPLVVKMQGAYRSVWGWGEGGGRGGTMCLRNRVTAREGEGERRSKMVCGMENGKQKRKRQRNVPYFAVLASWFFRVRYYKRTFRVEQCRLSSPSRSPLFRAKMLPGVVLSCIWWCWYVPGTLFARPVCGPGRRDRKAFLKATVG